MAVMQHSIHSKFILTPIIGTLKDAVNACAGIGNGIETQSLGEYVLQTTFLKMTGTSEQKLKCICWEMATNDYDYRYRYLKKNYGECSSYSDKCSIYKDMLDMIRKLDASINVDLLFDDVDISSKEEDLINNKILEMQKLQELNKNRKLTEEEIENLSKGMKAHYAKKGLSDKEKAHFSRIVLFESIQDEMEKIIGNTLLAQWEQHSYINYSQKWKTLSNYSFAEGDNLLVKELQDFYTDIVYAHRNRCAHNLGSYQNNLPTLKTLENEKFVFDNYYFRFSILILLDEIFIRLYKMYQEGMEKTI